jgi:hypothetical protein
MADDQLDRSQFFDKIGFGFANDGRTVELRFVRKNGKTAYVPCEYGDLASLILKIGSAAGQAFELQTQALGADPRLINPIRTQAVDRLQGASSIDGKPLITAVLKSGLRLELAIPEDQIPELIEWLETLESSLSTPRPQRN